MQWDIVKTATDNGGAMVSILAALVFTLVAIVWKFVLQKNGNGKKYNGSTAEIRKIQEQVGTMKDELATLQDNHLHDIKDNINELWREVRRLNKQVGEISRQVTINTTRLNDHLKQH